VVGFVDQMLKVLCLHKCILRDEVSGHITLALTCCRKRERGTSGATVLVVKGAWYIF